MSSTKESLKKFLNTQKKYDLKELKNSLKVFCEDEVIMLMLELLKDEINEFNENTTFDDFKYLYKCFKYFDEWSNNVNNANNEVYLDQLKQINRKLSKLIKNCDRKNTKGMCISNEFVLEKLHECIGLAIESFECCQSKLTVIDQKDIYDFLKYLIFDLKKFNYIEEVFNKFPELINANDGEQSIFDEIIDRYTDQTKISDGYYDLVYLNKIIFYFINNPKFRITGARKKKVLERLWQVIDNLKRKKGSKEENDQINFFLKELINNIKKITIDDYDKNLANINYKYNLPKDFSDDVNNETYKLVNVNGVYYRQIKDKYIITIDSNRTKSLDDAFSLEVLPNSNYLLGVYISDVSSYVKADTCLDLEAYKRSKTLYLPDCTMPMFPPILTYDFFSLNTNKKKLVLAHMFEFSPNMELVNYDISRAVVTIDKNFTYNDTDNILENGTDMRDFILLKNMFTFSEKLKDQNLSKNLYHEIKEIRRNAIFEDNEGYDNSVGSMIVEEFMVLVNHFIAYYFSENGLPFIYRINLSNCDKNAVIKLKEKWNNNAKIEDIINCINKMYEPSTYSIKNVGHYGLNLSAYAHTTIPIRNYTALINQRLTKRFLIDNQQISDQLYYQLEDKLGLIAKYLNERNELNEEYREEYIKIMTKKYKSN